MFAWMRKWLREPLRKWLGVEAIQVEVGRLDRRVEQHTHDGVLCILDTHRDLLNASYKRLDALEMTTKFAQDSVRLLERDQIAIDETFDKRLDSLEAAVRLLSNRIKCPKKKPTPRPRRKAKR